VLGLGVLQINTWQSKPAARLDPFSSCQTAMSCDDAAGCAPWFLAVLRHMPQILRHNLQNRVPANKDFRKIASTKNRLHANTRIQKGGYAESRIHEKTGMRKCGSTTSRKYDDTILHPLVGTIETIDNAFQVVYTEIR
jgi:hypothetical protein